MNQMRLVILETSGMIGGYALRYMLDHPTIERVTAIGRRKLGVSHPKLDEVLHQDFSDCSALARVISGQDACVFCLGTYTATVRDAELRTITVDYTIEFARVLRESSPDATFSFLSGAGADQTGRSRMAFARYKGEAEKGLIAAGFLDVTIQKREDRGSLVFENRDIRAMVESPRPSESGGADPAASSRLDGEKQ